MSRSDALMLLSAKEQELIMLSLDERAELLTDCVKDGNTDIDVDELADEIEHIQTLRTRFDGL